MLIRFTVGNFKSFNKNQTLSLLAGSVQKNKERLYYNDELKCLKFASLFGANASGKSNFIKAIYFANNVISDGTTFIKRNEFCKVIPSNENKNSYFEFEFLLNNKLYAYGFEILISEKKIVEEWLFELKKDSEIEVFSRNTETGQFVFDESLLNEPFEKRMKIYLEDFKNVSDKTFLSNIIENKEELYEKNPKLNILKQTENWLNNLDISFPNTPISFYDSLSMTYTKLLLTVIKYFNTGITNIIRRKISKSIVFDKIPADIEKDFFDDFKKCLAKSKKNNKECSMRLHFNGRLVFVTAKGDEPIFTEVVFEHNNIKDVYYSLSDESEGTQRLLDLLAVLLNSNSKKEVFIIDEIDRSLHPQLIVKFIQIFLKLATQKDIQLIISTHESHLMDLEILRQDEIFIVEKNKQGVSKIIPFDRFKERFDKKIEKPYLDGRYGGVPIFEGLFPFDELKELKLPTE